MVTAASYEGDDIVIVCLQSVFTVHETGVYL